MKIATSPVADPTTIIFGPMNITGSMTLSLDTDPCWVVDTSFSFAVSYQCMQLDRSVRAKSLEDGDSAEPPLWDINILEH